MPDRSRRLLAGLAFISLAALPLSASAQTQRFYRPPKVLKMGTHTAPIAGSGVVRVKVFIKKDGSIGSVQIEKSTNAKDNAAALQIAKSSTYRVGAVDGVPGDYFYTVALTFNGSDVSTGDIDSASSSSLAGATALIRAGKYEEAKAQLTTYVAAHPDDKDAHVLLGVAEGFLNDSAAASAAFDAAGTIPSNYRVVAAKAYADAAVEQLKAHQTEQAIALADKALALQENVNTLYILGTAYADGHQFPQAITSLQKAKALASSGKSDPATLNLIDTGLMASYLFGGETDKGLALAQDLRRRDPSSTRIDETLSAYYAQQAEMQLSAGRRDQAIATLESAATAVPKQAAGLYVRAANLMAGAQPPDWKSVKAEADKALAADPNDARANYIAGVSRANSGDRTGAVPFLQKAKANAGSDAKLASDVDAALKALGQK
jgi:tetratricopeptide (TPR) repeat protein